MTDTLTELIKRRDRIGDALQILEMSAGWRYMLASPQNRKYKALNAMIRQLEAQKVYNNS
jgi:predicted phosphatase